VVGERQEEINKINSMLLLKKGVKRSVMATGFRQKQTPFNLTHGIKRCSGKSRIGPKVLGRIFRRVKWSDGAIYLGEYLGKGPSKKQAVSQGI